MEETILGSESDYANPFAVVLAGGVGGARLARDLCASPQAPSTTVIVNVGDDERVYGVHVAADLDTVTYTLAGVQGPNGWGVRDDAFTVMDRLADLGVDTGFRLGDRDLATCLLRTAALDRGEALSQVTGTITKGMGVAATILPATDDRVRTRVKVESGEWLDFQEYFVHRGHRDVVSDLDYVGADRATPAPGTIEAIDNADLVVIAPSNPPLSIWPILAVPGFRQALQRAARVVAVSPLFGGKPLKGPADRVMRSMGLPGGTAGVLAAYPNLITDLVVDDDDRDDLRLDGAVTIHVADIRFSESESRGRFGSWLLERFVS